MGDAVLQKKQKTVVSDNGTAETETALYIVGFYAEDNDISPVYFRGDGGAMDGDTPVLTQISIPDSRAIECCGPGFIVVEQGEPVVPAPLSRKQ